MAGVDIAAADTAGVAVRVQATVVPTELRLAILADPALAREAVRAEDSLVMADSVGATAEDIADGDSG
jgi:hypothetical protein